jgi:signal transduction histidine kinase
MNEATFEMSRWAKLSIAGFTIGGSYYALTALGETEQWWLLGFLLTFALLAALLTKPKKKSLQHGSLVVLFLLSTVMSLFIHQHSTMLYVVVCLLAIEMFSRRVAVVWVAVCILAVFSSELLSSPSLIDIQDAFINSLLALFLSGFAFLRIEAENGRRHTRLLLHELEDKNRQLAAFFEERELQSRKEERAKLSRELHDTLGHKLTTSIVQLDAAEKFIEPDPNRVKTILTTVRNLLTEGLNETRDIVRFLDQETVEDHSLIDLVTPLVSQFKAATGLSVSLQIGSDCDSIAARYKQHIFRIIQEALTNISRHAEATEVSINLTVSESIALTIDDNGIRLNSQKGRTLPAVRSIESRVIELQGKCSFAREDARTKLMVFIPIHNSTSDTHLDGK